MTLTDGYALAVFALRKTVTMIEDYDEDADAKSEDVLEDIRALCADILLHLGDGDRLVNETEMGNREGVAAQRER